VRGRSSTTAIVVALVALAAAAAVEALRDDRPEPRPPETSPTPTSSEAPTARSLAEAGIDGVLFYTEANSCRLRALRLPEVRATRAPEWEDCAVSVSPDGRHAADAGAVWRADGELYAVEIAGGVDVVSSRANWAHRFEGARAPAFKLDGTLTMVRRGQLVEWTTACPRRARTLTFLEPRPTPRCARVLRTEAEITAAAPGVPHPTGTRLALEEVAWLDDRRFVALVAAGSDRALVVVAPRRVVGPWTMRRGLSRLEASPRRRYISLLWGADLLVFTRRGIPVEAPEGVRAFAWSPDDRWLAAAHGDSLAFYSVPQPVARAPYIAISAQDVEWR
jgi:hypothetical protein